MLELCSTLATSSSLNTRNLTARLSRLLRTKLFLKVRICSTLLEDLLRKPSKAQLSIGKCNKFLPRSLPQPPLRNQARLDSTRAYLSVFLVSSQQPLLSPPATRRRSRRTRRPFFEQHASYEIHLSEVFIWRQVRSLQHA